MYIKGRVIYDLLWQLSDPDWPSPKLKLGFDDAGYGTAPDE